MTRLTPLFALLLIGGLASKVHADQLTQIIQQDLQTLGYEPGNTDGEPSTSTAIAISKFQAEHGLEVTGEATPQLAGIIKSALKGNAPSGAVAAAPAATAPPTPAQAPAAQAAAAAPALDATALQAAQQACLQQKVEEQREASQRKRGFARLARAATRAASRMGGDGISRDVARASSAVYDAGAIAGDLKGAAEDLGLTESDIEECRNPF